MCVYKDTQTQLRRMVWEGYNPLKGRKQEKKNEKFIKAHHRETTLRGWLKAGLYFSSPASNKVHAGTLMFHTMLPLFPVSPCSIFPLLVFIFTPSAATKDPRHLLVGH